MASVTYNSAEYWAQKIWCQNSTCQGCIAGVSFVNKNPTSLRYCFCKYCGAPFEFEDSSIISKLATKGFSKGDAGNYGLEGGKSGKGGKKG